MSELLFEEEFERRGRTVLLQFRRAKGNVVFVDQRVEQDDGTMGRPVSGDGGYRKMLRATHSPEIFGDDHPLGLPRYGDRVKYRKNQD